MNVESRSHIHIWEKSKSISHNKSRYSLWSYYVSGTEYVVALDWFVSSQSSYVEALNPYCDCIWSRATKEVIKVKWAHKNGALVQWDWCPSKKRKSPQECVYTAKRSQQEGCCLQARKKVLPGKQLCQHVDLGLPASRTVRKQASVV